MSSLRLALVALALLGTALAATAVAARADARTPHPLVEASDAGRTVTVILDVTEKSVIEERGGRSVWDRSGGAGENDEDGTAQRIRGTLTTLSIGEQRWRTAVPALVFATVDDERPVAIGSAVEVVAVPRLTDPGDGAAVLLFASRPVSVLSGPPCYLAWARDLRAGFVSAAASLPGNGGSLIPGLAVGDTTAVSASLDDAMKSSSLSHLTAVSGANCAVIVAVLVGLLSVCGASRAARISGALVGLGLFVVLVTPEPSVVRAALMALAVLIALGAGRPHAGLPVLSLVVLVVVVADPWLSRSYGFVLSALATAGLLLLTRPLTRLLSAVLPRWLAAAFALPMAAQIACQPVLILLNPALPVFGVPANLLAAPAAPLATLLGLAGCILLPVSGPLAGLLLWLGWLPASWIAGIATTVHSLPNPSLPWLPGAAGAISLAALTVVAVAGGVALKRGKRFLAGCCLAGLVLATGGYAGTLAAQRIGPSLAMPDDWSLAACDVGQGDAIVVRSAGAVALIDTGAEPAPVAECLELLSIDRLDLLVLTHFDLDHVGGVRAVIGRAAEVLTGPPQNAADERMLAELAAGGAVVRGVSSGDEGRLGAAGWRVLWPPPRSASLWEGNAASVTLVIEPDHPDGIRGLFLGDLGGREQARIVAGHRLGGPVDLVKVAHHGSADQSPGIYEAAAARIGIVSVGAENGYGHPTPSILAVLAEVGTTPFRTDRCGLVVVGGTASEPAVWTERAC
ncbi:competence protein ComEC [Mycetocola sp. CAN_C7]|uniref:ComEC/Rec2 family competence protein n=1 Tax=Mycetocola sp. CAN_C7 TaxID=2787724 RepID=UPI0018CBB04B